MENEKGRPESRPRDERQNVAIIVAAKRESHIGEERSIVMIDMLGEDAAELLRGIHCVASGEAQQSGMTLEQDEVEILSSLLAPREPSEADALTVGAAIQLAWSQHRDLPPIELTDDEMLYLGNAAIAAMAPGSGGMGEGL